jgi:hypothetical protein
MQRMNNIKISYKPYKMKETETVYTHLMFLPSSNIDVKLTHVIKQHMTYSNLLWFIIYGTSLKIFHRFQVQLILIRIPHMNTV